MIKFIQSKQTLNTDTLSQNIILSNIKMKRNFSQVFINPYPQQKLLKFPKGKTVRKQTKTSTIVESTYNPQKPTIRTFEQASKTTLNQVKSHKRIAKFGEYHPYSSKSLDNKNKQFKIRTFEDIGIKGNMKTTQYSLKYKPDPIIGSSIVNKNVNKNNNKQIVQKKKNLSQNNINSNARKIRDGGNQLKQSLIWNVEPTIKRNFYKQKQASKINNKNSSNYLSSSVVSFIDTLNYSRKL